MRRQCNRAGLFLAIITSMVSAAPAVADETAGYANHAKAELFIDNMVGEGFDRSELEQLLADARQQPSILEAIARPAEKRLTWGEYRKIFLGEKRIRQGVAFWQTHADTLQQVSEAYGVPPEIIVAIIGVETRYGSFAGRYRVLDALATLAFDYPPRSRFFTGQLQHLLHLAREERLNPRELYGSYAGAMGYGQFIPSSYRHYAVDFDQDGRRDILKNPVDAIASVANYFKQHRWRTGEPVTVPARLTAEVEEGTFSQGLKPEKSLSQWQALGVVPQASLPLPGDALATAMKMTVGEGEEHWLGLHNFYVITRYNHSHLYAMAVYQLSQAIVAAKEAES